MTYINLHTDNVTQHTQTHTNTHKQKQQNHTNTQCLPHRFIFAEKLNICGSFITKLESF